MSGFMTDLMQRALQDLLDADLNLAVPPRAVAESGPSPVTTPLERARDEVTLTVHKIGGYVHFSEHLRRELEEDARGYAEARARWAAMTPEEQHAERQARALREALAKAERTCQHCGCDPDEHGGY